MDLDIIIPCEVRQRKANIIYDHLQVAWKNQYMLNYFTKQKVSPRLRKKLMLITVERWGKRNKLGDSD